MFPQMRVCAAAVVLSLTAGCGVAELSTSSAKEGDPFFAVSRGALTATSDAGADHAGDKEHFYLAIAKSELGKKWFMSGYLTQWYPTESPHTPMRSLGTRVVTFAVQNGKLYVFDATDGKAWSDVLDPTVVVEAYPIVTDYAPFNALPNAGSYVLFDPSAGQNRFDIVSDDFAQMWFARFEVDLSFLQKFKSLEGGASWEQVFTGHTELAGPGILAYEQPFRGSGTLSVTLRRYSESQGFQPTEFGQQQQYYFPSSNFQLVKNEAQYKRYTAKWNIKPGMTPIPWRISRELLQMQADPRYQGIDLQGAISRGVESWNDAFGFPVFTVSLAGANESPGDDDKSFIVVDRNPGNPYAFANWRENPNTGEIRGASVYFSATFVAGALEHTADAGELAPIDAGLVVPDAGTAPAPCAPPVVVSQVFGGNSSTGVANQDFVELHNRTGQAVSLSGWSLQYASANGTSWQVVPLSGSIPPSGFFLVGFAAATGGTALPVTPDFSSLINISASAGKLALVASTTALSGACPAAGAAVDFVGYGAASCSEATPISGASTTQAVVRRDACVDTDSNATDFQAQAPAPKNSGSAAQACTCTAAAPPMTTVLDPFGLGSPSSNPTGHAISWQAMPLGATCAIGDRAPVKLPAGMTRREFIERYIEHTIAHEIGHTLGLRHNFHGSLTDSSVMDYVAADDAASNPKPKAYDIAAVRFLYGLDATPPSQPFCTDESRSALATCDIYDRGANPLATDVAPRWQSQVRAQLAQTRSLTFGDIHRITRYVRGPQDEAQRLEAFNALIGDVAPPLQPAITGLSPNAAAWADAVAQIVLSNLFLDGAEYRDELQVNPSLVDATFRARVIAVAKGILTNSDRQRSFEARRTAVDVLKRMQTYDALQALIEAKAPIAAERATYNATGQALCDDLTRRIDVSISPYFVQ